MSTTHNTPMLSVISNSIVRAYRDAIGRGPTRPRSHYVQPDLLVCVLQDTLTTAERRLLASGEHQRVVELRQSLAHAMQADLRAAVQAATERDVASVVSGFNPWDDVATELFVLHG